MSKWTDTNTSIFFDKLKSLFILLIVSFLVGKPFPGFFQRPSIRLDRLSVWLSSFKATQRHCLYLPFLVFFHSLPLGSDWSFLQFSVGPLLPPSQRFLVFYNFLSSVYFSQSLRKDFVELWVEFMCNWKKKRNRIRKKKNFGELAKKPEVDNNQMSGGHNNWFRGKWVRERLRVPAFPLFYTLLVAFNWSAKIWKPFYKASVLMSGYFKHYIKLLDTWRQRWLLNFWTSLIVAKVNANNVWWRFSFQIKYK